MTTIPARTELRPARGVEAKKEIGHDWCLFYNAVMGMPATTMKPLTRMTRKQGDFSKSRDRFGNLGSPPKPKSPPKGRTTPNADAPAVRPYRDNPVANHLARASGVKPGLSPWRSPLTLFLFVTIASLPALDATAADGPATPGLIPVETIPADPAPDAPSASDFEALRKTSPFTRVLSLPETYALRGVAKINNEQVATLYNRETKKTVVITRDGNNEAGISLVGVTAATQLDGVTAKISFAGDEAELKYETSQLYPAPKSQPGAPGQSGRPPEGEQRGPSPQDIERYKALPEEKQAKLREYIGHVMRNYPNLSREERGNMIRGAMMRLTDGRDLEMPQGQSPGTPGPSPDQGGSSAVRSEGRSEPRGNEGRDGRGGERGDRGERR